MLSTCILIKMLSACIDHLKTQPFWILCLFSVGFLSLSRNCMLVIKWGLTTFFRPPKKLTFYGSWALITGSTDGIGKAFAFDLAKKGLNLVLVSRNLEKLKQVSTEIQAGFPTTRIKTIALDFSRDDASSSVLQEVEKAIEGLDIGVLINNVGVTYPGARFFHEVDEEVWMNVVRVNLKGTTLVTKAVLPGMLKKKRGAIVNLGSGAAIIVPSHPLYAIYAATKAYIDQFSRSLHVEYKGWGVDVQCQVPLYVWTKMASRVAEIEKSSFFVPTAEDYVSAAVGRIGYEARCTPWWTHSLQWSLASFLPEAVLDRWRLSIGTRRREINQGL
ncbi:very-long-chain 3-oxoacyl-CoA reductase-like protein At1g24470 [Coffea arabica]|uniref:Very-long-chain 3-oxoacyl-CoA reductase-like protein At1g24470 n=1 Tax=Coffea arabica TaxID=13443 RepID=A0A6P6UY52_COFAR|nr:very-long-chain 3-oxoacyl-CoA reductase-like protein At1g24470 [Coffea arabica]